MKTVFKFILEVKKLGYTTKQSELVLQCLKDNKETHLTAEKVYSVLKENNMGVGRTTVYRHLEKLYSDGIIKKFIGGDGDSACFQYSDCGKVNHSHYHLKCTCCGALFHTECEFLGDLSKHILTEHNFIVDGSKTVLYGLCSECAKSQKPKEGNNL
ncbi:MAG: Fur family transcriptional regulator [Oscillospiraceae bacterium]